MMLLRIADTSATSAAGERHPARRSVEKERAVGLSSALTVGSTVPDDYSFGGKRRLRTTKLFSRSRARDSSFRSSIAFQDKFLLGVQRARAHGGRCTLGGIVD